MYLHYFPSYDDFLFMSLYHNGHIGFRAVRRVVAIEDNVKNMGLDT